MSKPKLTRPILLEGVDPFYWYQGRFIDQRKYDHMGGDWKQEQRIREKTMIRDRRNKNGVFLVAASENDALIVETIIAWRDYALALEHRLKVSMTGQEWYDRFIEELSENYDADTSDGFICAEEAAKKAANIDE